MRVCGERSVGVLGEGEDRVWGCGGEKGRCVWEGCSSVEAQDNSKRKMSLGCVGGAWRGACVEGGWVGGWCVCVCEHKVM